eukprot:762179-Hanusia_phi.AAC.1
MLQSSLVRTGMQRQLPLLLLLLLSAPLVTQSFLVTSRLPLPNRGAYLSRLSLRQPCPHTCASQKTGCNCASCRSRVRSCSAMSIGMVATVSEDVKQQLEKDASLQTPVTVLSGFLGAGKTTLLQKMLSGKGGLKVGVVVNDLAAINIDSKLVKTDGIRQKVQQDGSGVDTDVIEMQNGCACCSASDDLIESLAKLLLVAAERGEKFDRLVIEGSGVTEPKNIRKQFFELELAEHPITQYCKLQNMITVVDSGNFLPIYNSADPLLLKSELVEESALEMQAMRKVASLLTEQVEVADYILLNKQDTISPEKHEELKAVVKALNPTASVLPCSYGDVDVGVVFGSKKKQWAAEGDEEMDFKRT